MAGEDAGRAMEQTGSKQLLLGELFGEAGDRKQRALGWHDERLSWQGVMLWKRSFRLMLALFVLTLVMVAVGTCRPSGEKDIYTPEQKQYMVNASFAEPEHPEVATETFRFEMRLAKFAALGSIVVFIMFSLRYIASKDAPSTPVRVIVVSLILGGMLKQGFRNAFVIWAVTGDSEKDGTSAWYIMVYVVTVFHMCGFGVSGVASLMRKHPPTQPARLAVVLMLVNYVTVFCYAWSAISMMHGLVDYKDRALEAFASLVFLQCWLWFSHLRDIAALVLPWLYYRKLCQAFLLGDNCKTRAVDVCVGLGVLLHFAEVICRECAAHHIANMVMLATLWIACTTSAIPPVCLWKATTTLGHEISRLTGVPRGEAIWAKKLITRCFVVRFLWTSCMLVVSVLTVLVYTTAPDFIAPDLQENWARNLYENASVIFPLFQAVLALHIAGCWQERGDVEEQPDAPCWNMRNDDAGDADGKRLAQWRHKVEELAQRGVTLEQLLDFYLELRERHMPHFDPRRTTTTDVVRHAVIPLSRTETGGCALSDVWNPGRPGFDRPARPDALVTHNWGNVFSHLVAAVVADGLGVNEYGPLAVTLALPVKQLRPIVARQLKPELVQKGSIQKVFWICAFSINQHAGICGSLSPEPSPEHEEALREWRRSNRDRVTRKVHQVCNCCEPKFFSDSPNECEMNKFTDMMELLSSTAGGFNRAFTQVLAIDKDNALFQRAWCIAECVEADRLQLRQSVKLWSQESLDANYEELMDLRIERCKASRREDKDEILAAIPDIAAFNARLQWLIFGSTGFFHAQTCHDGPRQIARATQVAQRALKHDQEDIRENSMPVELEMTRTTYASTYGSPAADP